MIANGAIIKCNSCGFERYERMYRIKKFSKHFCSRKCYWKNLVGRKLSTEHRATLGRNNAKHWQGKKFSKEHRENLSLAHVIYSYEESQKSFTILYPRIRTLAENIEWKKAIILRDRSMCQICLRFCEKTPHVDHYPKSFAMIVREHEIKSREQAKSCKELWDIRNGRVLCVSCHANETKNLMSFFGKNRGLDIKSLIELWGAKLGKKNFKAGVLCE